MVVRELQAVAYSSDSVRRAMMDYSKTMLQVAMVAFRALKPSVRTAPEDPYPIHLRNFLHRTGKNFSLH